MSARALKILRDLIAIPSVNPMRETAHEPIERGVADYLETLLRGAGIDCERQSVTDGRENLIAVLEPSAAHKNSAPGLMFNSHMDTVPVENMAIDPFDPQVKNERVYGRGACDAKGSLAAMLDGFLDRAQNPARRTRAVFAATADEEFSFAGAGKLLDKDLRVRYCVVGEPTRLGGIVAHKGVVRWRIKVSGTAAHGATPELGRNAIYDAARVALALEAYAAELKNRRSHRLLGHGAINVGRVAGGQSVNIVPDSCVFEIERRLLPGEDAREAVADCRDWVLERVAGGAEIFFEEPYVAGAPLETAEDSKIVKTLSSAQAAVLGGEIEPSGAHYCTDGGNFSVAGIETIVCGPGDIALAHTSAEHLEIEQLDRAARLYRKIMAEWA
ncbi:MAG TPA: M20 family metallopeptidase [Pyrinomonadaceae bacterium]|jgi:acetylornithine deacetylase